MSHILLTTAEVAKRLQVSVPTINRWVREGQLTPAQKLPGIRGARLFKDADVEAIARQLAEELRQRLAHIEQESA